MLPCRQPSDVASPVPRNRGTTHARRQLLELSGLGMRGLDEREPVSTSDVRAVDLCFRGVVRKRSRGSSSDCRHWLRTPRAARLLSGRRGDVGSRDGNVQRSAPQWLRRQQYQCRRSFPSQDRNRRECAWCNLLLSRRANMHARHRQARKRASPLSERPGSSRA